MDWSPRGYAALYPHLGDTLFNLAGRAVQIITWDRTHQFCGHCATPTELPRTKPHGAAPRAA